MTLEFRRLDGDQRYGHRLWGCGLSCPNALTEGSSSPRPPRLPFISPPFWPSARRTKLVMARGPNATNNLSIMRTLTFQAYPEVWRDRAFENIPPDVRGDPGFNWLADVVRLIGHRLGTTCVCVCLVNNNDGHLGSVF